MKNSEIILLIVYFATMYHTVMLIYIKNTKTL